MKRIITQKRVIGIIVSIFIILLGSVSPVYYANRLAFKFFPERNRTLLGLVHIAGRESIEKYSFAINNVLIPYTSFVIVTACTIILVVKLRNKTKWREQSTAQGKSDSFSNRDQKVSQMIVVISTLFIVCFTPVTIIFSCMAAFPEFSIDGTYKNMFYITFSFGFLMEAANSSMNIFIYYHMSSKYRSVFRELFHIGNNTIIPRSTGNKTR